MDCGVAKKLVVCMEVRILRFTFVNLPAISDMCAIC